MWAGAALYLLYLARKEEVGDLIATAAKGKDWKP